MVKRKKETTPRAQLQNLLVPVDFSPAAIGAVRYAAALAARHRSNIVLLHVTTEGEPPQASERAKKKLTRLWAEEGMAGIAVACWFGWGFRFSKSRKPRV